MTWVIFMVSKLHIIPMITIYQRPTPSKVRENTHQWIFQNKQQSKIQKSIARIMSKVVSERLHGSEKVEVEALLFLAAELSVVIENLKMNILCMPVCMCFCFLFFCGYNLWGKTENRRVQKTQLAFTAAKQLYVSEPIVGNKAKSCRLSFSSGIASLKLCSLGESDSLQVQPKKVFLSPVWPGRCSFVCWRQQA